MAASAQKHHERLFSPSAAIFSWLLPGLGYISLGDRKRGVLVMFGVLFLFFSGLLIGGLDCVDRKNDKLWFFAQSFCGPITFAADYANQKLIQTVPLDFSQDKGAPQRQRYEQGDADLQRQLGHIGLGRVNNIGTLFIALGGLMNLVVILDVLYYIPKPSRNRREGT